MNYQQLTGQTIFFSPESQKIVSYVISGIMQNITSCSTLTLAGTKLITLLCEFNQH